MVFCMAGARGAAPAPFNESPLMSQPAAQADLFEVPVSKSPETIRRELFETPRPSTWHGWPGIFHSSRGDERKRLVEQLRECVPGMEFDWDQWSCCVFADHLILAAYDYGMPDLARAVLRKGFVGHNCGSAPFAIINADDLEALKLYLSKVEGVFRRHHVVSPFFTACAGYIAAGRRACLDHLFSLGDFESIRAARDGVQGLLHGLDETAAGRRMVGPVVPGVKARHAEVVARLRQAGVH